MDDITIKQYKHLNAKKRASYDVLLHLKPVNKFGKYKLDINALTWEEVKGVFRSLESFNKWSSVVDIFETCLKIKEDVFYSHLITEYFAFSNYIKSTFIGLRKKEIELLHGDPIERELWKSAGGDRLNAFSDIIPLAQLGQIYSVYPIPLKDKPYTEILTLLVINNIQADVNKKFDKLKPKK